MKRIKLLSIIAACAATLAFSSCNTDGSSSSYTAPTPTESASMFEQINGTHSAGYLLPASVNANSTATNVDKFEKDSLTTNCAITASDSTLRVNVEVSKFAKYITDSVISKEVAALPAQEMKIKLVPYSYSNLTFYTSVYPINYTNSQSKKTEIQFVSGLSNYNYAFIGTRNDTKKKEFVVYLSPIMVYVDNEKKNVVKTYYYGGYTYPYRTMLEVTL